ncbi:MAG: asparaginase [Calditrichaeota bacterium]|nr:MAG: asparaginase [Calditrichota bacterium]
MKKILILHTGGTFGMVPKEPDEVLVPGNLHTEWSRQVPEITRLADIYIEIPFNMDSSNVGMEEWRQLIRRVSEQMNDYDGFVIIHGTDTMAYTASALSYGLRNVPKPVVLTGAQRPLARLRSDARGNLIDAIEIATMDIPEVVIVFGQSVLRGNRATKTSITRYDAFASPNFPLLGKIGLNVEIYRKRLRTVAGPFRSDDAFSADLATVCLFPGIRPAYYQHLLDEPVKAYYLTGFGAGNIPEKDDGWLDFIRRARQKGRPVFIGSSSAHGNVDLHLYQGAKAALQAGARGTRDMTREAALVKLMKLCALYEAADEIIEAFYVDMAGEITA